MTGEHAKQGVPGAKGDAGTEGPRGPQGAQGQRPKRRRINYSQTIIYILLVGMVIFVLRLDNRNDNQREADRAADAAVSERDRCVAAVDTRDVLRATVEAIYNLATGVVQQDSDSAPLTAEQTTQYNAYIERLNLFREDMYAKIKPSKPCEKYVDDTDVKPATPPVPPLPIPKES